MKGRIVMKWIIRIVFLATLLFAPVSNAADIEGAFAALEKGASQ